MIFGFSIAGFRSFSGEPQWVGPLSRINIFIGTNNSGKSNILRYILRVLSPALYPGRSEALTLRGVDIPRSGETPARLDWEICFDPKKVFGDNAVWDNQWTSALTKGLVFDDNDHMRIPVSLEATPQGRYFAGTAPDVDSTESRNLHHAWSAMLGMNGGNLNNWYIDLMNRIISRNMFQINPHFITSFRQLTTKLNEFSDEYAQHTGDNHLIDRLATLASPSYDKQEDKLKFEKLRNFIGGIINDSEVSIEIPADRQTINARSGNNFLPIEALGSGIHEVFMLASELILREDSTILLEEPEVHLHPHLQRRLMKFISDETTAQYFITTHSSAIIDTPGSSVFGVSLDEHASIKPLLTSQERFEACRELGFRASDLLQANCVIWVEGPSDRVYILNWVRNEDDTLTEGIHFAIMFYGGKLLSRLSAADDSQLDEFIMILPLCRNAALIADSDKGSGTAQVRDAKLRVERELNEVNGLFWLTHGREIENYYDGEARLDAVKKTHPSAVRLIGGVTKYAKPLDYEDSSGSRHEKGFDKMKIAKYLTDGGFNPSAEAETKIQELVAFIRCANS